MVHLSGCCGGGDTVEGNVRGSGQDSGRGSDSGSGQDTGRGSGQDKGRGRGRGRGRGGRGRGKGNGDASEAEVNEFLREHVGVGVEFEAREEERVEVEPKKTRGKAKAIKVHKQNIKGHKVQVQWINSDNPKICMPIKQSGHMLNGYIGILARKMVSIGIRSWDDVDVAQKLEIWEAILMYFDLEPMRHHYCMKQIGEKARGFRSEVTTKYLKTGKGKKWLPSDQFPTGPPKYDYSWITQDEWDEFIRRRKTEHFQEMSRSNQERAKNMPYPYRGSRKGFSNIENDLREKQGVEEVDRADVWQHGRMRGESYVDENTRKMGEKIDEVRQKGKKGEIELSRRKDVLAVAYPKPEHGGRTRGRGDQPYSEALGHSYPYYGTQNVDSEINNIKVRVDNLEDELKRVKEENRRLRLGNQPETRSDIGSCEISQIPQTDANGVKCDVAVWNIDNTKRIVASGIVFNDGTTTIHTRSLPGQCLRFLCQSVVPDEIDTPLPHPIVEDDIHTLRGATGYYMAWPIELIIYPSTGGNQMDERSKKRRHDKQPNVEGHSQEVGNSNPYHDVNFEGVPVSLQNLAQRTLSGDEQLYIEIPAEVFFLSDSIYEYVGAPEIKMIIEEDWLSASHISIWISCLYEEYIEPNGYSDRFGFLSPALISSQSNKDEMTISKYMCDTWIQKVDYPDYLFICPCNVWNHWVLFCVKPVSKTIYFLDPLSKSPSHYKRMTRTIKSAFTMYRRAAVVNPPPGNNVVYVNIQAPVQLNNNHCGYFIMRYMLEIVSRGDTIIPSQYFPDIAQDTYTQGQLDEIRDLWGSYLDISMRRHDYQTHT